MAIASLSKYSAESALGGSVVAGIGADMVTLATTLSLQRRALSGQVEVGENLAGATEPSSTPPGPSGCMKMTALWSTTWADHLGQLVEGAVLWRQRAAARSPCSPPHHVSSLLRDGALPLSRRAALGEDPVIDGYTVNDSDNCSTVSRCANCNRYWEDQLAGPRSDHHATIHNPVTFRQISLTKPSRLPCIFARAFPRSGIVTTRRRHFTRIDICCCVNPNRGDLGCGEDIRRHGLRSRGDTASPNVCHIAILPAWRQPRQHEHPVQSPAA